MRRPLALAAVCLFILTMGAVAFPHRTPVPVTTVTVETFSHDLTEARASRSIRPILTTTTSTPTTMTSTTRPTPPSTVPKRQGPAHPATTTTSTTTRPRAVPVVGACGGWADLVARYFPPSEVAEACRVLMRESGGDPNAVNPTPVRLPNGSYAHATGLMQILPGGSKDPETNMAQAVAKWRARGWQPWGG